MGDGEQVQAVGALDGRCGCSSGGLRLGALLGDLLQQHACAVAGVLLVARARATGTTSAASATTRAGQRLRGLQGGLGCVARHNELDERLQRAGQRRELAAGAAAGDRLLSRRDDDLLDAREGGQVQLALEHVGVDEQLGEEGDDLGADARVGAGRAQEAD